MGHLENGTGRTRTRLPRAASGAVAAAVFGALLLTGCGGGSGSTSDTSEAQAVSGGGGRPAPGPGATANGGPRADGGSPAEGGSPADGDEGEEGRQAAPDYRSTFALDVDTASYGYARSTLEKGRLPDPDTVRPEEFVNSFQQGYRRPQGNGFSVSVDGARSGAAGEGWSLLRVGLATKAAAPQGERPPAALTFVVDISGSMAETGRLDLVKSSLAHLTDELRDDDSVALVTFSDEAETLVPMTRLRGNRTKLRDAVESMETTDSTNVAAGVERGYDEAAAGHREGATNRVVLLSDALANSGETDVDAILERIEGARRDFGITLFGVGVGSDYGDAFMEKLTNKGDGNTTYIGDETQARKVFVDQLPAHVALRARDAKAQVVFDRKNVAQFRLLGYENRKVADEDFRNDAVDGGEVGPGHTVTALYAVRMREGARGRVATATVRWLDPETRTAHERSGTVDASDLTGALWSDADERLRVSAVAAYFALRLRGDDLAGAPALDVLARHARELAGSTEDTAVAKLATAVEQADALRGGAPAPAADAGAEGEVD
ncbi:von Willebrand factor type A domain-containing protein [uncultured Streptomyces sp.]|uniref:vWA domain-containing protein n=1 Tax=uncultured Streptomyces sp. TaxID=174707 RepID=UPI00262B52AD|nr:von Willebrand factor type A domain-containing protein [uncultured Streptomyces sp.]